MICIGKTIGNNVLVEMSHSEWENLAQTLPSDKLTFTNLRHFTSWIHMQQFILFYKKRVISDFRKYLYKKTFVKPIYLYEYIHKNKSINNIIKTARLYLRFCEDYDLLGPEIISKYRKKLVKKNSLPDVFVPSDETVLQNYDLVKSHKSLSQIYLLLATSGIRFVEALNLLSNLEHNFCNCKSFCYITVNKLRGAKRTNTVFIPSFVCKNLTKVDNSYKSLHERVKKRKCTISLKYLRKWHYNFMLLHNVPESVADFIQGRSPKTVSAQHYLGHQLQAKHWYAKLVPELEKMFK